MQGIYNHIPETIFLGYTVYYCNYIRDKTFGTLNINSHVKCFVLLHQYFPQYVYSAQYGCFLHVLDSCNPDSLLRHFLNDVQMVPIAPLFLET